MKTYPFIAYTKETYLEAEVVQCAQTHINMIADITRKPLTDIAVFYK